jgi:hypothetical protein
MKLLLALIAAIAFSTIFLAAGGHTWAEQLCRNGVSLAVFVFAGTAAILSAEKNRA